MYFPMIFKEQYNHAPKTSILESILGSPDFGKLPSTLNLGMPVYRDDA